MVVMHYIHMVIVNDQISSKLVTQCRASKHCVRIKA